MRYATTSQTHIHFTCTHMTLLIVTGIMFPSIVAVISSKEK
jgi:hypothetical protein